MIHSFHHCSALSFNNLHALFDSLLNTLTLTGNFFPVCYYHCIISILQQLLLLICFNISYSKNFKIFSVFIITESLTCWGEKKTFNYVIQHHSFYSPESVRSWKVSFLYSTCFNYQTVCIILISLKFLISMQGDSGAEIIDLWYCRCWCGTYVRIGR